MSETVQLIPHQDSPRCIRLNGADNVAVVVNDGGVPVGAQAERLVFEGLPRPLEVLADPDKLLQALTNLLSNAFKYSPGGGPVTVRVLEREADGQFLSSVWHETAAIHESAAPIAQDVAQPVDEPVTQTKTTSLAAASASASRGWPAWCG